MMGYFTDVVVTDGSSALLRLLASVPGSPADGDFWNDSGTVKFKSAGVVMEMTNQRAVQTKSANYGILAADSGSSLVATAALTFTLPAAAAGLTYTIAMGTTSSVSLAVQLGEALDGTTDGTLSSTNQDGVAVVACFTAGRWTVLSNNGWS
jgi:hypothetical protein